MNCVGSRLSSGVFRSICSSSASDRQRVCLVVGAGAGIGLHVAQRFAREGYLACLARRSDQAGLDAARRAIEDDGGVAKGFLLDAHKPGVIESLVEEIEAEVRMVSPSAQCMRVSALVAASR